MFSEVVLCSEVAPTKIYSTLTVGYYLVGFGDISLYYLIEAP